MRPFRDFMEQALYDPERGFYLRRTPSEDFYTAPELHGAFAAILTRELVARLQQLQAEGVAEPYSIVEMGSGCGSLARQVLSSLKKDFPHWSERIRYIVVERSSELMLESVVSLSSEFDGVLGHSRLSNLLPCTGVFFSNELVDAFPVHLLEKRDGRIFELFVEESGRSLLCELSTPELEPFASAVRDSLEEGGRHAVNLDARQWLRTVSEKLEAGFLLTVDYGKRFGTHPNPPRTYYKHSTDENLTEAPGKKDLTASVDFDELISQGQAEGLALESYRTLTRFLLDNGISDLISSDPSLDAVRSRNKIKTLLHPEAMGEAFKVLVQRRVATREPAARELRWSLT